MSSLDERPFPTFALVGAGLLVLSTVVGVGFVQLQKEFNAGPTFDRAPGDADQAIVETRDLLFVDQQDGVSVYGGQVKVFDAGTGEQLPDLLPQEGFVRAVLNSLAFERSKLALETEPRFQLSRWTDDRIVITDTATGASINLGNFGQGNKAVFLRFFASRAGEQ